MGARVGQRLALFWLGRPLSRSSAAVEVTSHRQRLALQELTTLADPSPFPGQIVSIGWQRCRCTPTDSRVQLSRLQGPGHIADSTPCEATQYRPATSHPTIWDRSDKVN